MSDSDKELENQILEAGQKLTDPPSSLDELLLLLDKLFIWLIDVDQSPHESMQSALCPLMKALVAGKLFNHSDVDVRVAVAACISEITRITAHEAPDDSSVKAAVSSENDKETSVNLESCRSLKDKFIECILYNFKRICSKLTKDLRKII